MKFRSDLGAALATEEVNQSLVYIRRMNYTIWSVWLLSSVLRVNTLLSNRIFR